MNPEKCLENMKDFDKAAMLAPFIWTREMDLSSGSRTTSTVTDLIFPVCLHEEAVSGSLISYSGASI